jgi:hypothetical protein
MNLGEPQFQLPNAKTFQKSGNRHRAGLFRRKTVGQHFLLKKTKRENGHEKPHGLRVFVIILKDPLVDEVGWNIEVRCARVFPDPIETSAEGSSLFSMHCLERLAGRDSVSEMV